MGTPASPVDVEPAPEEAPALAFLFPGQGAEVAYSPQELCDRFPVFGDEIRLFAEAHGIAERQLLDGVSGTDPRMREFAYQPSLAAVQVALARLLEHLGAGAATLCGSSVGEYAAAHLAGLFGRQELMTVLAARDRLMRATPEGRMVAVSCSAEKAGDLLVSGVELASDNAAERVLLSAPIALVDKQLTALQDRGVDARVLPGRIAPHSALMEEAGAELREVLASARFGSLQRPVVSTLTGAWLRLGEAETPDYWVRHLCRPVRFRQALETLREAGYADFVEASPGDSLTKLVRMSIADGHAVTVGTGDDGSSLAGLLRGLGDLWTRGAPVRWDAANDTEHERFAILPAYPFQRRRLWNHTPAGHTLEPSRPGRQPHRVLDTPAWRPDSAALSSGRGALPAHVLIRHADGDSLAAALAERLARAGVDARLLSDASPESSALSPGDPAPVLVDLTLAAPVPAADAPVDRSGLETWLERGLMRPLRGLRENTPSGVVVVTRGLWPVLPGESGEARSTAVVGLARCAPHEWPGLTVSMVDLEPRSSESAEAEADVIAAELADPKERDLALRRGTRYRLFYESAVEERPCPLRAGGTYLLLGGTGRLGPVVAEAISSQVPATIVIAGRDPGRAPGRDGLSLLDTARERGCTVIHQQLDAADPAAMEQLLDRLTTDHGRVDGVFHLAANTAVEDFPLLADLDTASAAALTEAKVVSAAALRDVLRERDYDFVVLFSSISTIIGGLRFGAYVSSNAYLDGLAAEMSERSGRRWISAVWDGWNGDGSADTGGLGSSDGADMLIRALRADRAIVVPAVRNVESRRALVREELAEVAEAASLGVETVGNRNAEAVLSTVREVTGHEHADLRQSFAGLGIDSLQMMQIAARLRPLMGESVSLGSLLAAGSVADIVHLADEADQAAVVETAEVAEGALSSMQQRLWYLHQLDPASIDYNVPFGWVLPDGSTAEQARAAVQEILVRHEVLRSAYRPDAEQIPQRVVLGVQDVPVEVRELDPDDPADSFADVARARVETPFDLESSSTRVLIAHGRGVPVHVLFVCHHVSVDAWSVKIIQEELESLLLGTPLAGPSARGGYRDFVQWEHDVRAAPGYADHLEHWKRRLADVRPTVPPADAEIAENAPRQVAVATRLLPTTVLEGLRRATREAGATLYTAGLAGLALALSRWCGESEIVVGTNRANRARAEFEGVVGMFVDPIVLRLEPGGEEPDAALGSVLHRIQAVFAESLEHAEVPYMDLVHHVGRGSGEEHNPLFSVIVTMFDTESRGGTLQPIDVPLPTTPKFPLAVEFLPRGDGLLLHVLYAADRYLPSSVERLLARVARFLELLAEQGPQASVKELSTRRGPAAPGRFVWRS
ncbi:condensation domain-containing protein [Streptomonospora algeriensis]|uniref:Condensation domain-containing protein n=1 Tax=Streptomonospora algeriensis TaxID=995084 RepID=A0ABW3BA57_9ACTN